MRFDSRARLRKAAAGVALLFSAAALHAATLTAITGESYDGNVTFDNGLTISPKIGPATKLDFSNILHGHFNEELAETGSAYRPGVVLQNGTRLAAAQISAADATIKVPKYNLTVPSQEVAWITYQSFPESVVEKLAPGATGALLPGGDFFEGTIKSADD